jgi:hypothetical protein
MRKTKSKQAPEPTVSVVGKTVTVIFEMPFMEGDKCITPRNYKETRVSGCPEVSIRILNNLTKIEVGHGGSWYSEDHTQMHGVGEFLPDKRAFLDYWLGQAKRDIFEDRLSGLLHFFKGDDESIAELKGRHVQMLRAELEDAKQEIGQAAVNGTKRALQLEAAIAKATGSNPAD